VSSHSLFLKYIQTDITCEEERRGKAGIGLVGNAHAQRTMGNGVVIQPHDFKQPSRWKMRVWKVTTCESGAITYGIKSIQNFMKIHTEIIQLKNVHTWISQLKFNFG
jgi:hypothetical protein